MTILSFADEVICDWVIFLHFIVFFCGQFHALSSVTLSWLAAPIKCHEQLFQSGI